MKLLLLSTLFIFQVAHAENFRVGDVAKSMRIIESSQQHLSSIEVTDGGKSLFKYHADLVTQKLLQTGLVRFKGHKLPYLVTVWTSGVHGQELIVFDLSKAKAKDPEDAIAYLYGSAWTIDLKIDQDKINITGKGETNEKSGVPDDQHLTFRP